MTQKIRATVWKKVTIDTTVGEIEHRLRARMNVPGEIDIYSVDKQLMMYRCATVLYRRGKANDYLDDDEALAYVIDNELIPEHIDLT